MIILKRGGTPINTVMAHAESNPLVKLYHNQIAQRSKLMSMPVCPRCERTGLRDKGWKLNKIMACPHCGYRGKATHVLSAYISEGLYK